MYSKMPTEFFFHALDGQLYGQIFYPMTSYLDLYHLIYGQLKVKEQRYIANVTLESDLKVLKIVM